MDKLVKKQHQKIKRSIVCELCKKNFNSLISFRNHLTVVHKLNIKNYYNMFLKNKDE